MEYIKKEELIIGEIYNCASICGNKYIVKIPNDLYNSTNINKDIPRLYKMGNFTTETLQWSLTTPEEKHWLNEAIKLNKFITFEEAMKTFIPEYVECTLQQMGSDYKLGEIYKVSSPSQNINKIESHNNQGVAFYQMNKHRFKPSTKEAYDAQFVVKEPEFVLPKKWCILRTGNNYNIINKWFQDNNLGKPYMNYGYIWKSNNNYVTYLTKPEHHTEITFEQFKKYVLKEEIVEEKVIEPLPQFKVIESIETITKVENNEGNQFFIGDVVKSSNGTIQTIESFDYNKAKTNIIAFTNKQSILGNGIGIDKIEHYIEPKVEVEETLLEKAKRLYPIGTKINSLGGSSNQTIDSNTPFMSGKDGVRFTMNCLVYLNGKWAEIIE